MRLSPSLGVGISAWGAEAVAAGAATGAAAAGAVPVLRAFRAATSPAAALASVDFPGVAEPVATTSARTMRPAGPLPVRVERSIPKSVATLRASGEALMRVPSSLRVGAAATAAAAGAGAGVAWLMAAAGALACGAGEASSPSRSARTAPMAALSPSWTRIWLMVPSSKASISMVALSVSTSARMSPISTESPTFLCHLMSVPSVMVSESFGISIWMAMERVSREGGAGESEESESLFQSFPVFSRG